jgi:hypothetical protein
MPESLADRYFKLRAQRNVLAALRRKFSNEDPSLNKINNLRLALPLPSSKTSRGYGETRERRADELSVEVSKGTWVKAIRLHRQGGPEQLVYEDAPKPELGIGCAHPGSRHRHYAC